MLRPNNGDSGSVCSLRSARSSRSQRSSGSTRNRNELAAIFSVRRRIQDQDPGSRLGNGDSPSVKQIVLELSKKLIRFGIRALVFSAAVSILIVRVIQTSSTRRTSMNANFDVMRPQNVTNYYSIQRKTVSDRLPVSFNQSLFVQGPGPQHLGLGIRSGAHLGEQVALQNQTGMIGGQKEGGGGGLLLGAPSGGLLNGNGAGGLMGTVAGAPGGLLGMGGALGGISGVGGPAGGGLLGAGGPLGASAGVAGGILGGGMLSTTDAPGALLGSSGVVGPLGASGAAAGGMLGSGAGIRNGISLGQFMGNHSGARGSSEQMSNSRQPNTVGNMDKNQHLGSAANPGLQRDTETGPQVGFAGGGVALSPVSNDGDAAALALAYISNGENTIANLGLRPQNQDLEMQGLPRFVTPSVKQKQQIGGLETLAQQAGSDGEVQDIARKDIVGRLPALNSKTRAASSLSSTKSTTLQEENEMPQGRSNSHFGDGSSGESQKVVDDIASSGTNIGQLRQKVFFRGSKADGDDNAANGAAQELGLGMNSGPTNLSASSSTKSRSGVTTKGKLRGTAGQDNGGDLGEDSGSDFQSGSGFQSGQAGSRGSSGSGSQVGSKSSSSAIKSRNLDDSREDSDEPPSLSTRSSNRLSGSKGTKKN